MKRIEEKVRKLNCPAVALFGKDKSILLQFVQSYVSNGFKVLETGVARKYFLFGEKKYYIIFVADRGYYEGVLNEALSREDYKVAAEMKKKIDNLK